MTATQSRYRAAGLCINCAQPRGANPLRCDRCKARNAKAVRIHRLRTKMAGRCLQCKAVPLCKISLQGCSPLLRGIGNWKSQRQMLLARLRWKVKRSMRRALSMRRTTHLRILLRV